MVARKRGAESGAGAFMLAAFDHWRRLLDRALGRGRGALASLRERRLPGGAILRGLRREPLVALGVSSLVAGVVVAAAYSREAAIVSVVAGITTVLLAAVRLVMLILLVPHDVTRRVVARAWGAGLLVWIAAIDPLASAACWAVSAPITRAALVRAGVGARLATRVTVFAWGAHAVIAAALWLARSVAVGLALA